MSKILYIDAGHGGVNESGKYTTADRIGKKWEHKGQKFHKGGMFYEGVFNRSIAQKFMQLATEKGFHCIPVYHPINDTSLGNRVDMANKMFEKLDKSGTYLSFHSNAFNGTVRGFNLFYHPHSPKGKSIAESIVKNVNQVFINAGSINRNPLREGYFNQEKTAFFYVLQATDMPALLFEFGFFDNAEDAKMLFSTEFQTKLATELVNSLSNATLY